MNYGLFYHNGAWQIWPIYWQNLAFAVGLAMIGLPSASYAQAAAVPQKLIDPGCFLPEHGMWWRMWHDCPPPSQPQQPVSTGPHPMIFPQIHPQIVHFTPPLQQSPASPPPSPPNG